MYWKCIYVASVIVISANMTANAQFDRYDAPLGRQNAWHYVLATSVVTMDGPGEAANKAQQIWELAVWKDGDTWYVSPESFDYQWIRNGKPAEPTLDVDKMLGKPIPFKLDDEEGPVVDREAVDKETWLLYRWVLNRDVFPLLFVPIPKDSDLAVGVEWGEAKEDSMNQWASHPQSGRWRVASKAGTLGEGEAFWLETYVLDEVRPEEVLSRKSSAYSEQHSRVQFDSESNSVMFATRTYRRVTPAPGDMSSALKMRTITLFRTPAEGEGVRE